MKKQIVTLALMGAVISGLWAQPALVGKEFTNITLTDANDKPKNIPYVGQKVLVLFYTDPDVKDVNDPLSEAIKKAGFSTNDYQGIGIANCKDTWLPNSAIRMKSRQKEQQFPGSVIMIDDSHKLSGALKLGDCNEKGIVLIVGKDKKIKYVKSILSQEESKAQIASVIKIIKSEL